MRRLFYVAALVGAAVTAKADILPPGGNSGIPANEARVDFGHITSLTVGGGYTVFVGSTNATAKVSTFASNVIGEYCAKIALISQANKLSMTIGFAKMANGQPNAGTVLSCTLSEG